MAKNISTDDIIDGFNEIKEEFEILEQMMLEMKQEPNRMTTKAAREQSCKVSLFLDSLAGDMIE